MFSKCESQSHKDCLYSTVLANCNVIVCDAMDFVRSRKFKLDAFALLYIIPFFHENQKNALLNDHRLTYLNVFFILNIEIFKNEVF